MRNAKKTGSLKAAVEAVLAGGAEPRGAAEEIALAIVEKAKRGDLAAAAFLRDTLGEKQSAKREAEQKATLSLTLSSEAESCAR